MASKCLASQPPFRMMAEIGEERGVEVQIIVERNSFDRSLPWHLTVCTNGSSFASEVEREVEEEEMERLTWLYIFLGLRSGSINSFMNLFLESASASSRYKVCGVVTKEMLSG